MSTSSPPPNKVARLLQEAVAEHRAGNMQAAERAYRKVLKTYPREPDSLHLLGLVRIQQGDIQDGVAFIKRAVAIRDDFPDAHTNLALALWQHLGDTAGAEHHFRRALVYKKTPQAFANLGNVLRERGLNDPALAAFKAAADCEPRSADGYLIYARALRMTSEMPTMLAAVLEGLKLSPRHATLHLLASEAYFALGCLGEGWREYRWRFESPENRPPSKSYPLHQWQGESLAGRTLLIWAEQGPGDEIMYASMYPDVIAAARRCLIQCSPRLAPLMRRTFPEAEIFDRDLSPSEFAGVDFQAPAGNLGEWLRPTLDSFPSRAPYINVDNVLRDQLRARYQAQKPGTLLVGIAWRSVNTEAAPDKTVSLLDWGPILQVPGLTFINLQYGDNALELMEAMKGFKVSILQDDSVDPLRDMDAFAAQVAAMDFVVTSSNTAAHVAGAVGVSTFCMLPASLGRGRRWYWFAESADCPWYPKLRRFVRGTTDDWIDVICGVGIALNDEVAARGVPVASHLRAMANAFARAGRPRNAETYLSRLGQEPGMAGEAYVAIADLRVEALDAEGAFAALDRAIAIDPNCWQAYNAKGAILGRLNRFDEAISAYRAGLALNECAPELHNNLGTALLRVGRSSEALEHYESARKNGESLSESARKGVALNLAAALDTLGRSDDAVAILDQLIVEEPGNVDAHYNRARSLLADGKLKAGWEEFEWRLKRPNANVRYDSFPHLARWSGENLKGTRPLVWTEQGIGDEILTASMIPDAIAATDHVTLLCSPRLVKLFRRSFPSATVDERRDPFPKSAIDPRISFQMSISDLGRAFRPDIASFPVNTSYLKADDRRRTALREKYQALRPAKLLVGVSWSSHGNAEMGWLKSNNLAAWKPILQTQGVAFVNLQYGDRANELAQVRELLGVDVVNDPTVDPLADMDTFAAQVAAMDLVISTSNTAVHAAGALGIPTWVLAPQGRGRHWYWFRGRYDSPWYPSLRFVEFAAEESWEIAIVRCAAELGEWVQSQGKNGKI